MAGIKLDNIKQSSNTSSNSRKDKNTFGWLNKDIKLFKKKLNDKKKEAFYSELGILLEAGVDIRSALDVIAEENKKKKSNNIFESLKENVVSGDALSEAMEREGLFSTYELFSIRIGEETGRLPFILKNLAAYFKDSIKQRRQIIGALTYPAVVFGISILAIVFLLYFIVPMFAGIFERFGGELPAITVFVIDLSEGFQSIIGYVVLGVAITAVMIYWQRKATFLRKWSAWLLAKVPFIGGIAVKSHLIRFTTAMALLTGSRVHLMKSLELLEQMIHFFPLQQAISAMREKIMQGDSLYDCMQDHSIFPHRLVSLVKIGEEVNQLDVFFEKITEQYTEEVEHKTSILGNLIEPVLLVFLGLMVATVLIAMYLPLFQLSSSFQ